MVGKGARLDRLRAEVRLGEPRREAAHERAYAPDCSGIGIHGAQVIALLQEEDEVASAAATRVEDSHPWRDAAAQDLVEQVDVDLAEEGIEVEHRRGRRAYWLRKPLRNRAPVLPRVPSSREVAPMPEFATSAPTPVTNKAHAINSLQTPGIVS